MGNFRSRFLGYAAMLVLLMTSSCSTLFPHGSDEKPDFTESVVPTSRDLIDPDRPFEESRYLPRYTLNPGDNINVAFDVREVESEQDYRIEKGDKIGIKVLFHEEINAIYGVRPDGKISLPYKGDFVIVGMSPMEASGAIAELYGDLFVDPSVSLQLESSGERIDAMRQIFDRGNMGQSWNYSVGPDGFFNLPMVGEFSAPGLTVAQLENIVNSAYARMAPEVKVNITLTSTAGFGVFVMGEVNSAGRVAIKGPVTASRALAMAGGFNPNTADLSNCILLSLDVLTGEANARVVDLEAVLTRGDFSRDPLLGPNDVLVVPSTKIVNINRWVDQYISKLLLFRGVGANMSYRLN
jgi:polysaccharide biosynthesis/export protein